MNKFLFLILFSASLVYSAKAFTMSQADLDIYFKEALENNPGEIELDEGSEQFEAKIGEARLAKYLGISESDLPKHLAGFPRLVKKAGIVLTIDQLAQAVLKANGKKVPKLKKLAKMGLYIKSLANDEKVNIDVNANPEMKAMYALGKKMYTERRGNRGMSCWGCHTSKDALGQILRTQKMVDISSKARASAATWPAYRMAKAKVITVAKRLQQCQSSSGQAVLPQGAREMVALEVYVTELSNGATMAVPGLKR